MERDATMKRIHDKNPRLPTYGPPGLSFPTLDGGTATRSVPYVVDLVGVTGRTVNRWRRTRKIPPTPLLLLQLDHAGRLLPASWSKTGARFQGDQLAAGGYTFSRGQLQGYGVICQALAELQRHHGPQRPAEGDPPRLALLQGGKGPS